MFIPFSNQKIKVGLNGASCTVDADCLNGAETITSYVYCKTTPAPSTCSCRTGFTWNTVTRTCKCLELKELSGSGASTKCRKFLKKKDQFE